jgi:hypothetical protein
MAAKHAAAQGLGAVTVKTESPSLYCWHCECNENVCVRYRWDCWA